MTDTTVIRNATWLVAWDGMAPGGAGPGGGHRYLKDADLAFRGETIVHLGPGYDGPVAREVDGTGLCVLPGLIDVHAHPLSEPLNKGFSEDAGNPRLGWSGLYDVMPAYGPDQAGMGDCAEAAYAELLLSGVTTLIDLSVPYPGWLELAARSGLRAVLAPMFRSGRWYTDNGFEVKYDWSEDGGDTAFDAALEVVDRALGHDSGRLGAMITPSQVDTCTPELLQRAKAAAAERGVPLHIHAAQSLVEFQEMTRRHGLTPIQWLDSLGMLGPSTIIAHAIFLDSHSWISWGTDRDLDILAASGASVAHCPNNFVRHGILLESFARYRAAGIDIGIGTDTYPHNMIEELRLTALLARIQPRSLIGATTAEAFEAATLGGARLLGREDIGRLAPGAKADLVLVDLEHPAMRPVRDPLRSLVFSAAERAVRDVYVGGEQVVRDGRVLTLDHAGALDRLDGVRRRAEARVPERDWAGRSGAELSPLSLPVMEA
jgi:cytosine/adenosine deaminase-related metal-dependent hydrolase